MVNLTIRLSKGAGEGSSSHGGGAGGAAAAAAVSGGGGGGGAGGGAAAAGPAGGASAGDPSLAGAEPLVTVSCPDHLVLADLPVAKGLGSVSDVTVVKILGRKARRRLGDKVHFCVRCDFPIAFYGRLDPCEHVFCLTCARRDSCCYLCGERVARIQRLEVLDGIFICGAPRCLRSFLKRQDFQQHIKESHADLMEPVDDHDKNPQVSSQKATTSETHVQAPTPSAQLPQQEQKGGPSQVQASEDQSSRSQPRSGVSSSMEEKQTKNQGKLSASGPKQSESEGHQKQRPGHGERSRRQRQEKQQLEEARTEEHSQVDRQHIVQPSHARQPGLLPVSQPLLPTFSPQPFPPPYPMPEGHTLQPMYPQFQIPSAGHLPPPPPPLPPPRPPPSLAPPPPLMPPPPPKRGKFEPGMQPTTEAKGDPHSYPWSGPNPNYDSNWNYGGWSGS